MHIGFGSFVDKNLPPFTSTISSFNCDSDNAGDCSPPYRYEIMCDDDGDSDSLDNNPFSNPADLFSYHHQTTLREFTAEEFKEEVLNQPLAGNVDEPEGSLDALMQAMVCRQRVGWRQNARKIILMATDREESRT